MPKRKSQAKTKAANKRVKQYTCCAAKGCEESLVLPPNNKSVLLCDKCFDRINILCDTIGMHWYTAHIDPSYISWSSHPEILPPTVSPLVSSRSGCSADPGVAVEDAVKLIKAADCLCIIAGAGASADSGVPTFRGPAGFYRANGKDIPMEAINFHPERNGDMALSWGLLVRMMQIFDEKTPHEGYYSMLKIARSMKSFFVFTSNIDGYFARTGYSEENIFESHGNVDTLQCTNYSAYGESGGQAENAASDSVSDSASDSASDSTGASVACSAGLFCPPVKGSTKWFNDAKLGADMKITNMSVIPTCPKCKQVSRPNISHCTDHPEDICYERKGAQEQRFHEWIKAHRNEKLVVLEVGCGTSAHSLRDESELLCEKLWRHKNCKVVRIDPGDCNVPKGHVGIRLNAKDALNRLAHAYFEKRD